MQYGGQLTSVIAQELGEGEGRWTKARDDVLRDHISFAKSLCSPVNMSPLALTAVVLTW